MSKDNFPICVQNELAQRNINPENIIATVRGDMDDKGNYYDVFISFDNENIYVITGLLKVTKSKSKIKRLEAVFEPAEFKLIPINDIDSMRIERMISTSRLIATKDDNDFVIAKFSLGLSGKMDVFTRRFNAFKTGDETPISEQDFDPFCPECGLRFPEPERRVCPHCIDKTSLTLRIMSYFKGYKKQSITAFLCMLVSSGFTILSPYIGTKMLFDDVLSVDGRFYGRLVLFLILIFASRFIGILISIAYGRILANITPWLVYDIKLKIFKAMQSLSMGFYTSKQTGSLMNRINNDADSLYWFFIDGLPYSIVNVLTFLAIFALMFWMNWQLALIIMVSIPVIIICFRFMWKILHPKHHKRFVSGSDMTSFISDALNGQRVVKAFSKEQEEEERFNGLSKRFFMSELSLANTQSTLFPIVFLSVFISNVIVIGAGGIKVASGTLSIGTFLIFIAYINMLYDPLIFLSWVMTWWARCVDAAQRVFEIIDSKPDVAESENPVRMPELKGDIVIDNITFEYEPGFPVISDASLSVKSGQMLGIVGKTGAGKSTMVNLIARLYDPKCGNIYIDGVNIKDIAISDLRKNIGIVSQEIYLFMGSIADNIRYAKPSATMEEVIEAAKAASAHDFIMNLSDGYDTRVGSGGNDLSGGEKQRVSIARAIIQNPKILILDEATASMDTETEKSIQQSIERLKEGRTTITIAHRLSTLRNADMLAVIEDGKVVEYDTHLNLINKKGAYFNLYKLQSEALKFIGVGD